MKNKKLKILKVFLFHKKTASPFYLRSGFPVTLICSLIFLQTVLLAENPVILYETHFYGTENKELISYLNEYSELIRLKNQPPASLYSLKKRADKDRVNLINLLKSKGFFKGEVTIDINTKKNPIDISVTIKPDPRFKLKNINIKFVAENPSASKNSDSINTGLLPGSPYHAGMINEGGQSLLLYFKKFGYPFVKIADREIIADHLDNTVNVTYIIETGPKALFGETTFTGIESVDETYVRSKLLWKQGQTYNIELINKTHHKLTGLGLFSIVTIRENRTLVNDESLPLTVEVKERKRRSIGAGLFYKTDEGPGIKAMWENRNIMGKGEKLTTDMELSDFTLALKGVFRKPDFYRPDQNIKLSVRLAKDEPDAYKSRYLETTGIIERKLSDYLDIGGGLAFKSSTVDQLDSSENYSLFYVPLFTRWDKTDDLLDPKKGNRISMEVTPFYDISGSKSKFIKGLIDFRYYLSPLKSPSITLATNLTIGSIYGASSEEIPADERFYAGGGGSVRGYAYQSIGPYLNDVPYGGKSLIEISFEPRIRLSDKFGIVFFIDGGTAYSSKDFSSSEDMLWGAGAGIRYYTPIGPIRMDIGIPLDRRKGIDDSFQIYLSIGQAF